MRYYVFVREGSLIVGFLCIAILAIAVSGSISRGGELIAELETCHAKFAAVGLTEQDAANSSDKKVIEVCGFLPKSKINSAWHSDRSFYIGGNREQFVACQNAFEEAGYAANDVFDAADETVIDICETIPKYLSY